jgi:hypothetical protein
VIVSLVHVHAHVNLNITGDIGPDGCLPKHTFVQKLLHVH